MQSRIIISILVLGILQCLLLLLIALTPTPEQFSAVAHSQFNGMMIGLDGASRLAPIEDYAFYFYLVMLAQICAMVALGVVPKKRDPLFWLSLSGCFGLAAFVWWQMFSAYKSYLATGETTFVAGFPLATTWQVYAVWLAGLGLVALYVLGFKRYVWSDKDQQAFDALVESSTSR